MESEQGAILAQYATAAVSPDIDHLRPYLPTVCLVWRFLGSSQSSSISRRNDPEVAQGAALTLTGLPSCRRIARNIMKAQYDESCYGGPIATEFPERLRQVIAEFGSRYNLAKCSRIPASTLQSYEAGSKPGLGALTTLARVANVDLNWLVTGRGEKRPAGMMSGATLADFVVVYQYEMGTALCMSIVIGQVPFSRHYLESRLRLKDPSNETLLLV